MQWLKKKSINNLFSLVIIFKKMNEYWAEKEVSIALYKVLTPVSYNEIILFRKTSKELSVEFLISFNLFLRNIQKNTL